MEEKIKELLKLSKECLSIVNTSTLKDKEITMLINSAISDLKRLEIDVKNTIVIYVKANFGDGDIDKRNEYLKRYKSNLRELQFSEEYRKVVDNNA